VLDSRTLSNGTSPRDTTCDSRQERAGVDTYLGYRGPPRGRAGLRECLVSLGISLMLIPERQRAPEPMLPFARLARSLSMRNLRKQVIDRTRDNALGQSGSARADVPAAALLSIPRNNFLEVNEIWRGTVRGEAEEEGEGGAARVINRSRSPGDPGSSRRDECHNTAPEHRQMAV